MNKLVLIIGLVVIVAAAWLLFAPQPSFSPETGNGDNENGQQESMNQEALEATRNNLVGQWQSTQDANFTREFKADGTFTDSYEGEGTSTGTWTLFTESTEDAPEVSFPIEAGATYLQMVGSMVGSEEQDQTVNFKLTQINQSNLELIYMDRGGVLQFERIE